MTGVDYFYINAITLGIVSVAFLVSFWLPMPQRGVFFKGNPAVTGESQPQRGEGEGEGAGPAGAGDQAVVVTSQGEKDRSGGLCPRDGIIHAGRQLWRSFRESYSSRHLLYYDMSCNTFIPLF